LASWFRGRLGESFQREVADKTGIIAAGYFSGKVIDKLIGQHRSGVHDHSRVLWLLWMFQGFLRDVHAAPATVADI
jgi:asparagine synthase (glutamine-hydrolysing)